jgi:hypothetical protein
MYSVQHNYYLSKINSYMFRLIYSHHQADRDNKQEMLAALWKAWDFEPYLILCMK